MTSTKPESIDYNSDNLDNDGRCIHCGAGNIDNHSYSCPTDLHPDKRDKEHDGVKSSHGCVCSDVKKPVYSIPKNAFKIGDIVSPVTIAGLELGDVPINGEFGQRVNVTYVFRVAGIVQAASSCHIDYNAWGEKDSLYADNLGKIFYTSYLISCDAGDGWAGMGAIKKYISDVESA